MAKIPSGEVVRSSTVTPVKPEIWRRKLGCEGVRKSDSLIGNTNLARRLTGFGRIQPFGEYKALVKV